eukprot:scaffold1001_cov334-Prasinococcus_capsulatus_cf.AAC.6
MPAKASASSAGWATTTMTTATTATTGSPSRTIQQPGHGGVRGRQPHSSGEEELRGLLHLAGTHGVADGAAAMQDVQQDLHLAVKLLHARVVSPAADGLVHGGRVYEAAEASRVDDDLLVPL